MVTQQYVFLDDKDSAIKFLEKREADRRGEEDQRGGGERREKEDREVER